jgi:hypothetical protein
MTRTSAMTIIVRDKPRAEAALRQDQPRDVQSTFLASRAVVITGSYFTGLTTSRPVVLDVQAGGFWGQCNVREQQHVELPPSREIRQLIQRKDCSEDSGVPKQQGGSYNMSPTSQGLNERAGAG